MSGGIEIAVVGWVAALAGVLVGVWIGLAIGNWQTKEAAKRALLVMIEDGDLIVPERRP